MRHWVQKATSRRIRTARCQTVSGRRWISLGRQVFTLWDEVVRLSMREACQSIAREIEEAERAAEAHRARLTAWEAALAEDEQQLCELESERLTKETEATSLADKGNRCRQQATELLEDWEAQRHQTAPLQQEVARLQVARDQYRRQVEPELRELERQLLMALEVQGNLRFSLFRCQEVADGTQQRRDSVEAKTAELRDSLGGARASYLEALEVLDQKVADLELEGREAELATERLERALEDAAFRSRLISLELERWSVAGAAVRLPPRLPVPCGGPASGMGPRSFAAPLEPTAVLR